MNDPRARLGDPDLQIAQLRLWVHSRQFPESDDYWDGNWLAVTAECSYPSSWVRATGPILHLGEVQAFLDDCQKAFNNLEATATLECMEPNLRVELAGDGKGHFSVKISLTPEHMTERHDYQDEIDQTYLPEIMARCQSLLRRYPFVGQRPS